jgi:hypothetical protein
MNSQGSHQFLVPISAKLLAQVHDLAGTDNISVRRFVESAIEDRLRDCDPCPARIISISSEERTAAADQSLIDQFILDATELAVRLDTMTTRDHRHDHDAVAEEGRQIFRELQRRFETMKLNEADSDSLCIFLDGLRERLKFLELRARTLQGRAAS